MTIRRATVSDAPALSELAARTFAETFSADNSPQNIATHLETSFGVTQQAGELSDPEVITLLAYVEGNLVGYAQVRRKSTPACVTENRPVELHRLYLTRSAHGRGVAARLMHQIRTAAKELGGHHLWLGVWERNPRAVAFYVKSGFVQVGSHEFVVGRDRQTDWVLVSPLSEESGA